MDELERTVAQHTIEIANLKEAQRQSEARIMEQIREVQRDMRDEIARLDAKAEARERATNERLDRFEAKLDTALDKLRRSVPAWVGPLIGALIAVGGWLLAVRG